MKNISIGCVFALAVLFSIPAHGSNDDYPVGAKIVQLENSSIAIASWDNAQGTGYSIKRSDGTWHRVDDTSYSLKLRFGQFDPVDGIPPVPEVLSVQAAATTDLYLVQFLTQPLVEYRQSIEEVGGKVHKFLPYHTLIVALDPEAKAEVEAMPFVRWVGRFQPAYKLERSLTAALEADVNLVPRTRVNLMMAERGPAAKAVVDAKIRQLGGTVELLIPDGYRMEATLTGRQMLEVLAMPEVMWMDRWTDREVDMDVAREISGGNYVESVAGYTGTGVRAEAMDTNLFESHVEFSSIPPIFHGNRAGSDSHGTGVYGICFAEGVNPEARGMMPDAQGIFADYGQLQNRYQHTAELTQSPYQAVLQTNSWGNARTTEYTSVSAEMDDIIFLNDILITQSQSNAGNQDSRPQAWAKNIVSVGGFIHGNTLTKADDFWAGASIGPAEDGRIKPDFCHFYDSTFTTADQDDSYRQFGGTSGATPIVAGHFGLFFQMWSDGIFGNTVNSAASVFDNRCHAATAKAILINQASSYPFSGLGDNFTRTHQGWGLPDLQRLYDARESMFVIDESVVLQNLDTVVFPLNVAAGQSELRATMVYADPMGNVAAGVDRINDLTLKVTAPNGTVYWGNNGLLTGNWSSPGGSANTIDTVENVFVQSPAAGTWTVEVIASEVNEDGHTATGAIDADFALVVSGVSVTETVVAESFDVTTGNQTSGGLAELQASDDSDLSISRGSSIQSVVAAEVKSTTTNLSPGEMVLLVEASVFSRGAVTQTTRLFNYETDEFEVVDVRTAARFVDQVIEIDVTGDVTRFIETGTQCMTAELRFQGATQRMAFTANVDFVQWTVGN